MPQANLLGWVKVKDKKAKKLNKSNLTNTTKRPLERWAYRFLRDFREGLMTPAGPVGPFKAGDLVSRNAMSPAMWAALLEHGAVEPVRLNP